MADDAMADEVRWLDHEEQQAWRALLAGWSRLEHRLEQELKQQFDLTLEDYEILVFLSEAEDRRLKMSELSDELIASKSRVTYRVDRLERAGLVERRQCEEDGRSLWAELTDAGWNTLRVAAPVHVTAVREQLVDCFDSDEFVRLGRRFADVAADS